jgi:lysophospholipase L1-like esterase
MRRFIAGSIAGLTWLSAAAAQDPADCAVAHHFVYADYGLNRAAATIDKEQRLDIVVVGTGSSQLRGPGGEDLGYPARMQAALTKQLPKVAVRVVAQAKAGRTTADMARELDSLIGGSKPTLVVWQTGTVDAMRGVDPDLFRAALEEGVEALRKKGVDAVLMNMQYSPRTESIIALGVYADNMRVVSQQHEVPLFDRLTIMKHWSELGTFDLYAATKNIETASRVHDCIGQLLADLILEGVRMSQPQSKVMQ